MTLTALVVALVSVAASCGQTEFERLAVQIGEHTGVAPTEVEAGIRAALSGRSDTELTQAARDIATRTAWIDGEAARLAEDTAGTRKAIAQSTCDWLDLLQMSGKSDEERNADLDAFIYAHLRNAGLSETEAKDAEVRAGIIAQIDAYKKNGKLDYQAALKDAACFLFG